MKTRLCMAVLAGVLAAGPASADVELCLNRITTITYQCYETDKKCADIPLGPIIRECKDLIAAPGGGGGGGVVSGVHPILDGQPSVGPGSLDGQVLVGSETLERFLVIRETRDEGAPGRRMQAVGRTSGGALYLAEFDVAGQDRRSAGELMFVGTPGGQDVFNPFDDVPSGHVAQGDMTVTVYVIDPADGATVLETHHTPVVFAQLSWTFLASGPVPAEAASWGLVKARY